MSEAHDCPVCDENPCVCEPCPNCGETDHCGIFACSECKQPTCECCGCNNMHFACEAGATGGLYIGKRGKLEPEGEEVSGAGILLAMLGKR